MGLFRVWNVVHKNSKIQFKHPEWLQPNSLFNFQCLLIYSSLHYVYSISLFYFHLSMTFWKRRNVQGGGGGGTRPPLSEFSGSAPEDTKVRLGMSKDTKVGLGMKKDTKVRLWMHNGRLWSMHCDLYIDSTSRTTIWLPTPSSYPNGALWACSTFSDCHAQFFYRETRDETRWVLVYKKARRQKSIESKRTFF